MSSNLIGIKSISVLYDYVIHGIRMMLYFKNDLHSLKIKSIFRGGRLGRRM